MAFEKAEITPAGQLPIKVLFNPNKYSLQKGNQISEIGVPGLQGAILQYVRGNARTLSMELFFDTYEQQKDVREHTSLIYKLLEIDPETHAPPICTFSWGGLHFAGVVDKVAGNFTLFLTDGTPARATLNVAFKEYIEVAKLVRGSPTHSSDHVKTRMVKAGETLSGIAALEYGDPGAWRPIARANRITRPRRLAPGRVLVIPRLKAKNVS